MNLSLLLLAALSHLQSLCFRRDAFEFDRKLSVCWRFRTSNPPFTKPRREP
ncbi:hypothetical protein KC19_9G139500 [Ceratodon purpureus]|uniref:Uncharacterized protein n=1 Tax=Ceratodon purpureus TaxID=3225 RepID=A0A8T0GVI7_CERPU|nr:hypothetical protein KC19_9G139500 [Ceratodon purpureus]